MNISITKQWDQDRDQDRYWDQNLNGTGTNHWDQKWLGPRPIIGTRNDRSRSRDVLCLPWEGVEQLFSGKSPSDPLFIETQNYTIGAPLGKNMIFDFSDRTKIQLMGEHLEAENIRVMEENTRRRQFLVQDKKSNPTPQYEETQAGHSTYYVPWSFSRPSNIWNKKAEVLLFRPRTYV